MKSNKSNIRFFLTLLIGASILLAALGLGQTAAALPLAYDTQTASAACQVFQPSAADAYIRLENQSENKGTVNELIVKTETGKLIQSLVSFQISGIPAGAVIDNATLSLWVKDVRDGNVAINARPVTQAWGEKTITWRTFGGSYGAILDSEAFVKGVKNYWATWDVTSAAIAWVQNPAANNGLVLESPVTSPKSEVKFKSREDGTASQRPKLTICWSSGISVGPDRMAQGYAGQTTSYPHIVNVGALTDEVVYVSAASSTGWSTRIYIDANADGDKDSNTPIMALPVMGPNAAKGIVVELDVPAGAANGIRDDLLITASAAHSGLTDTAVDRTQIGYLPIPDPILDGKKDLAYSLSPDAVTVDYCDASGKTMARLMSTIDLANPDYVWVILEMDLRHVDNTYGANTHPSWAAVGKTHTLASLDGSDAGQVILTNGSGAVIYDVTADYFETNLLGSAGINAGEGSYAVLPNNDPSLVGVETSIGYSLQTYCAGPGLCTVNGLNLLADSPPIDANYTAIDPTFADWQFSYLYEFRFNAAAFGSSGLGEVRIDYVHVSPNKTGTNVIIVEPCDGSIGDRVWRDSDGDGTQDAGESGLNGIQVNLYRDNGDGVLDTLIDSPIGLRFTTGDGNYDFTGLGPDTYWVDVVDSTVPAAYFLTTANDPLPVKLAEAEDYNAADFGYNLPPGNIGDYVWNDINGNGIQDESLQYGLDDIVLHLYRENGDQVCDSSDAILVDTQITAGGGYYTFAHVALGDYCVDVEAPGGYELIPGPQSNPDPLLVLLHNTYAHLAPLRSEALLGSAIDFNEADFAFAGRGNVTGFVYYDWNQNGTLDIGEDIIPGVEVCLYHDANGDGVMDPGATVIACQTTDGGGAYNFHDQVAGAYLVVQTQPPDLQDTTPNTLAVQLIVIGVTGSADDNNFGEIIFSRLGDFIFLDTNGNNVQDPGETQGVPGIPITVTALHSGDTFVTASDAQGFYLVDGLLPGAYSVQAPAAWPGLVRTTAAPRAVTLGIAETRLDIDFGYIAPTAVWMTSFTANSTPSGVLVQWSTQDEHNQAGFRILRSSSADGVYKIVSGLIAAANDPAGASYQWLDNSATAGDAYWYKIESAPDGQIFGPVRSQPADPNLGMKLFLPRLHRLRR